MSLHKSEFKRMIVGAVGISFAFAAMAERISSDEALSAATAFLTRDGVGGSVLAGRMTGSAHARGNLWVVELVPSGSIVFSGSDIVKPIVSFSANDFTEPAVGSAFYDRLERADADALAAEVAGSSLSERHEKWIGLIGQRGSGPQSVALLAVSVPEEAIVVKPFLTTHWNQWQPYNDYAPIYDVDGSDDIYRGRAPCGCVATALAQTIVYWKWPRRAEGRSYAHVMNGKSGTFDLRFNAGVPFDWGILNNEYEYWKGGYDLREKVAESIRNPIARLIFWCDSLVQMAFGEVSSSAHPSVAVSGLGKWYAPMRVINRSDEPQTSRAKTLADLQAKRPVNVLIPGHAIVAHGWASDNSSDYVYVNYGWGGEDDGWMPFDDLDDVVVEFYPRKMVQVDPLPVVGGTTVGATWTLPDCHANSVTGFRAELLTQGTTPQVWTEDFTNPDGIAVDSASAYVDDATKTLKFKTATENAFVFGPHIGITTRSVLTYRIYSEYARGVAITVEAKSEDGDWQAVSTPVLCEEDDDVSWWGTQRVFLGGFAGKDLSFRIAVRRVSNSYYSYGYACIDDFSISDALTYTTSSSKNCGASARSVTFTGCSAGAKAQIKVTPLFGSENGLADRVTTRIAGAATVAVAGSETLTTSDLNFSSASDIWDYSGSVSGTDIQSGIWNGGFSVRIDGALSNSSALQFGWTAKGYYGDSCYDQITAVFEDATGTSHSLTTINNTQDRSQKQSVNCSLGAYAGQKGVVRVSFMHSLPKQYDAAGYGVKFYSPKVTNVMVPTLPSLAWENKSFSALAMPQILAVAGQATLVDEGFYRENSMANNVLHVVCSETVSSLVAKPSHLSLMEDGDITVINEGGGRFAVVFKPKAAMPNRSRMILTLEARDDNGSVAYEDLSLRFSSEKSEETYAPSVAMADGNGNGFAIPVSWFVGKGLVASGATVANCANLVGLDADGDGVCNWKEYICGTHPCNASDKLVCTITVVGNTPVVDYSPKSGFAPGYSAVLQGKSNLGSSDWQVKTASHRFFRVTVERAQ